MHYLYFTLLIFGFSCTAVPAQVSKKLAPDAFAAMLQTDSTIQFIDVRTPEEYRDGHIAGSMNWNIHAADFSQKIAGLDKKKPVMVYCAVGGRSGNAARRLSELGFEQVYDLEGGIKAWKAAGKPVEK